MIMMMMKIIIIIIIIIIITTIIIIKMMIIIKQFCETKTACSNVAGCSWILEQVRTFTSYLKMILNKCRQSIAFVVKHLTVSFWSHYLQSAICFKIMTRYRGGFFPRIRAIIPATRYTCVVLPRILVSFPALWGFYSQVYDHFLTNAHIYAHKKAHIYALQTSMWYMGLQKVVV